MRILRLKYDKLQKLSKIIKNVFNKDMLNVMFPTKDQDLKFLRILRLNKNYDSVMCIEGTGHGYYFVKFMNFSRALNL